MAGLELSKVGPHYRDTATNTEGNGVIDDDADNAPDTTDESEDEEEVEALTKAGYNPSNSIDKHCIDEDNSSSKTVGKGTPNVSSCMNDH